MTAIQTSIQEALERHKGIRRKRAVLAAFAALVFVFVLTAILDRMWMFSGWPRWSGWVAGLVVASWAARRAAGAARTDATTLAHQIEAEAGETSPVLATAIDPAVRRTAGNEAMAGLWVERLDLRAAEALRVAPPTFRGQLRIPAGLFVAAVAALVALVAVQGGNGLLRMMIPWLVSPYTLLSLEGPKGDFAQSQAFTLTARVSGLAVEKVTLYRQDSPKPLAESVPDHDGLVRLTVDGLDSPADFVVRAGDGQSAPLHVSPYALPRIAAFEIVVTAPAYASHATKTETAPSFSVLRDSRMRYRVRLKAPAVAIAFERSAVPRKEERVTNEPRRVFFRGPSGSLFGKEDATAKEPAGPVFHPDATDPLVWEAEWNVSTPEDIVYRLTIKGEHGDHVRNDEAWRINVLADAPPVVRIQNHNGAEVIRIGNETVNFNLSAVDDVHLTGAWLVFRKPGQPHIRQKIKLPGDAGRTWSGAELLALASLEMQPLDIIAVHAEAEDSNILDGPGVGRSEVVYLEVPPRESDNDGGGGGGGGGGSPPINPRELQMEILQSTIVLRDDAPVSDREAIAHDQRQNAEYVGMIERAVNGQGFMELGSALRKARMSMQAAARLLNTRQPTKAIPDEEAALGSLIDAAKLLEEVKGQLAPGDGEGMLSFSLSPSRSKGQSDKAKDDKKAAENQESLRKLLEEVQRQLAEQEKLNQGAGEASDRSSQQQSLAKDARSAAGRAENIQAAPGRSGNPQSAAAELDRAAALQDDTAEALASGDGKAALLGAQSAEALSKALRELAAQLKTGTFEGAVYPPGFERLVGDYLRSISNE